MECPAFTHKGRVFCVLRSGFFEKHISAVCVSQEKCSKSVPGNNAGSVYPDVEWTAFSSVHRSISAEHCVPPHMQSKVSTLTLKKNSNCKSSKQDFGLIISNYSQKEVRVVFISMWNRWLVKKWPTFSKCPPFNRVVAFVSQAGQARPDNSEREMLRSVWTSDSSPSLFAKVY